MYFRYFEGREQCYKWSKEACLSLHKNSGFSMNCCHYNLDNLRAYLDDFGKFSTIDAYVLDNFRWFWCLHGFGQIFMHWCVHGFGQCLVDLCFREFGQFSWVWVSWIWTIFRVMDNLYTILYTYMYIQSLYMWFTRFSKLFYLKLFFNFLLLIYIYWY